MSNLRLYGFIGGGLLLLIVAASVAFNVYGRQNSWQALFGPADLGPYDFSAPSRTGQLNDYLACPETACGSARPEFVTRAYTVPAAQLFAAAQAAIRTLPGKPEIIGVNPVDTRLRAVIYTPTMRVPTTLSLQVKPDGDAASMLFVYSRSRIGFYDFGRDESNVQALIAEIDRAIR